MRKILFDSIWRSPLRRSGTNPCLRCIFSTTTTFRSSNGGGRITNFYCWLVVLGSPFSFRLLILIQGIGGRGPSNFGSRPDIVSVSITGHLLYGSDWNELFTDFGQTRYIHIYVQRFKSIHSTPSNHIGHDRYTSSLCTRTRFRETNSRRKIISPTHGLLYIDNNATLRSLRSLWYCCFHRFIGPMNCSLLFHPSCWNRTCWVVSSFEFELGNRPDIYDTRLYWGRSNLRRKVWDRVYGPWVNDVA